MSLPTTRMPDAPRPASFKVDRMSNVLRSVPITGAHRAQTRVIGESYWSVDLSYNPMREEHFGPLIAFLNKQNGMHEAFGVTLPNFDSRDVVAVGNYISLSNGKCVQIETVGSLSAPSQLFVASTNPTATQTFTNSIAVTSGVPVSVYVEADSVVSSATVEMWTTNTGSTGSNRSNVEAINAGRNMVCLTPTVSGSVYIKVSHGTTASLSSWSLYGGLQVGIQTATTAPSVQASDAAAYYLPGPVAVIPVSLSSNKMSVEYGKDSFIKLKVGLTERR
jgi:hypothetical protein